MKRRSFKSFVQMALTVTLLVTIMPAALTAKNHNFQAGLHFLAGFPQGEFEDAVDANAYGGGLNFLWSPSRSPFGIGVSLGILNYGSESRREPFSTTIPDVTVEVTASNNMFQGQMLLRAQPKRGDFRPYADALFGLNYLWTETKITDADNDAEEVASSTNQDDAALSYGAGGGIMFRIYSSTPPGDQFTILIDVGARYLFGGEAEYLKEGSIRRENGEVTYDVIKSETDLAMIQVGIVGTF